MNHAHDTPPPADLTIRMPEVGDENGVRAAHQELWAHDFPFAFGLTDDISEWCQAVRDEAGGITRPGRVREVWQVAVLDDVVVGRLAVRPELNNRLRLSGGHIGYAVRPAWRGRGIARVLLADGLRQLAAAGVGVALATCDDRNAASARVLERAGARLCDVIVHEGRRVRRYEIATA